VTAIGQHTGNGLPALRALTHVRRVSMKFGVGGLGALLLLLMMVVVLWLLPILRKMEKYMMDVE
jgi:hypothetical protein